MPETTVQTPVCGKCGVDVRPGTMYCYNCGGYVGPAEAAPERPAARTEAPARNGADAPKPAALPFGGKNLRTAAAIRRRSAAVRRAPVEVRWEAPEEQPSGRLIIVTAAVALFALLAVILALYL